MPLPPEILVSLGGSKYFLSGFAMSLELFLKPLRLDLKFNSASNGAIFSRGHRTKNSHYYRKYWLSHRVFKVFSVGIRYATWDISKTT